MVDDQMVDDQKNPKKNDLPLWIKEPKPEYEKILGDTYRWDEVVVFFDKDPSKAELDKIRESFTRKGFGPIEMLKCDNCDIPVQLWKARNIHTIINTGGVRTGAGPATTAVGEKYCLNFFNNFPVEKRDNLKEYKCVPDNLADKKEKIIVAVLDTGFDTNLVDKRYLWKGEAQTPSPCYRGVTTGWNFLNNTAIVDDDNPNKHGSIVSQFIINQFKKSPNNVVQIMPLKTHDKTGQGDLFSIICAIHFAIAKGAHIINASWGFYYYYKFPIPYLEKLITVTLQEKGILFVTAAGNKDEAEERMAKEIYQRENRVPIAPEQLRDLAVHNFHPAVLGTDKNSIVTATTTDGKTVSATQNYSNLFVDLGVMADKITPQNGMEYQVPFNGSTANDTISGSSFATAIASGIIGAFCDKGLYRPNIQKKDFFRALKALADTGGVPDILRMEPNLEKKLIKKGCFTKKRL